MAPFYRSQAKACTHNFHAYASADVVFSGERLTMALTPVAYAENHLQLMRGRQAGTALTV